MISRTTLCLLTAALCPNSWAYDWPQWAGPRGDFVLEQTDLLDKWSADGPRVVWEQPLGFGYSSIVADTDTLYTMYHEDKEDVVVALDKRSGRRKWEQRYREPFEGSGYGPGPNATPLLVGDRLFTLSAGGRLSAFQAETGKPLWSRDVVADFEAELPWHGYASSPLHFEGRIIVPVGGSGQRGVAAFAPDTGRTLWQSARTLVGYASPRLIRLDGEPQVVINAKDRIFAVDPRDGREVWSINQEGAPMHNATLTPLWGADRLLWISARGSKVGDGNRTFRLTRSGDTTSAEQVYWKKDNRVETHVNALRSGETVYTSLGSNRRARYVAIDVRDGSIRWEHPGLGGTNSILIGERLIILDEFGRLLLAQPNDQGLNVISSTRLKTDRMWTLPVLTDGLLIVRDHERIMALQVGRE